MDEFQLELSKLMSMAEAFIQEYTPAKLNDKPSEIKWSKKEILGHLIDSGLNNLQRFTEIQFMPKPYQIRKYDQDELVKANGYQSADIEELLTCWTAINKRIIAVFERQTSETLAFELITDKGQKVNLQFWIKDYLDHMKHHLDQIMA